MLTRKQNMQEVVKGGAPDRFVKQYEALHIVMTDPYNLNDPYPEYGECNVVNSWGVTISWPLGTPGGFPVHDEKHIVCPDITKWKDTVKAPKLIYPESAWETAMKEVESIDRNEFFIAPFIAPGVFERVHYLMSIEEALVAFYLEPEKLHELIKYITDWELLYAEQLCKYLKPDALFHHDDWGSQTSTFVSPEMFEEFIYPSYKQIYGYYKSHGVEMIVHHSDSYAETLVPFMIDMGIDVWQGAMSTNNIKSILEKYGDKLTIMGGIDSAKVDHPGWTRQEIASEVRKACSTYGKLHYIPSASQGLAISTFDGVYEALDEEIDNMSKEMF